MHGYCRRAVLKGVVLQERHFGKRGERLHAVRFVPKCALRQCQGDARGRTLGEIRHERFRRLTLRHSLGDGEIKSCSDTPWITRATRRDGDEHRSFNCIVAKSHLCALAVGGRVVKRERKTTQSTCQRPRARSITAARSVLKKCYRFLKRQNIQRDLIGYFAPV
jgi:hypothetical protein